MSCNVLVNSFDVTRASVHHKQSQRSRTYHLSVSQIIRSTLQQCSTGPCVPMLQNWRTYSAYFFESNTSTFLSLKIHSRRGIWKWNNIRGRFGNSSQLKPCGYNEGSICNNCRCLGVIGLFIGRKVWLWHFREFRCQCWHICQGARYCPPAGNNSGHPQQEQKSSSADEFHLSRKRKRSKVTAELPGMLTRY